MYIFVKNHDEELTILTKLQEKGYMWSGGKLKPLYFIENNKKTLEVPPYYIRIWEDRNNELTYNKNMYNIKALEEDFITVSEILAREELKNRLNKVIDLLEISGKNTKLQAKIELEKIINELGEEE